MGDVNCILEYLKKAPGRGLISRRTRLLM